MSKKKTKEKIKEEVSEVEEEKEIKEISLSKKEIKKIELSIKSRERYMKDLGQLYMSRLSLIQNLNLREQQVLSQLNKANGKYALLISNYKFKYGLDDDENWFYRDGKLVKGEERVF